MNGTRHEWIDELCARLERVLVGRAADDLLAGELPDRAAVVLLPVWNWLPPKIDMGRKTLRADGDQMLMPVRVTWSSTCLLLVTEPTELDWSLSGLGNAGAGRLVVIPSLTAGPTPVDVLQVTTQQVAVLDAEQIRQLLTGLSEDGRKARWEALMSLEHYVDRAVHNAVAAVSYDVTGADPNGFPDRVLDETGTQGVVDQMLLGTADKRGSVDRLIERCLAPGTFERVDPLKYVVTDLHRSAEAAVRKAIGDPHIGRKIRTMRRTMPSASVTEMIAAYRLAHPGDHLAGARVEQALSAGADIMARRSAMDPTTATVESHEDSVLDRVHRQRTAA